MPGITKKLAAAAGLVVMAGAVLAAPASAEAAGDPSALSCHGSAKAFSKPAGHYGCPTGTGILTTTTNCADINIRPTTTRSVKVCFLPSSAPPYCQADHKTASANKWTVVATDVANGTKFFFSTTAAVSGQWAA